LTRPPPARAGAARIWTADRARDVRRRRAGESAVSRFPRPNRLTSPTAAVDPRCGAERRARGRL